MYRGNQTRWEGGTDDLQLVHGLQDDLDGCGRLKRRWRVVYNRVNSLRRNQVFKEKKMYINIILLHYYKDG